MLREDVGDEAPKPKQAESTAAVQPVVDISKNQKPIYSDEARKLGLEGEVLVEVVFPAPGGPVQVGRVTKGLGHGLDEAKGDARGAANPLQAGVARRQAGGFSRRRTYRFPTRVLNPGKVYVI